MGIDTHRFIGPYLKIKVPTRDAFRMVQTVCCGYKRDPGFCPKCGQPVAGEKQPFKEELVCLAEIGWSIRERLRPLRDCCGQVEDGFHYWMENGPGAIDEDKPGAQEMTARDIERALNKFRVEFGDDIATIEKAYGCQGQVVFGLLVWAS